MMLPPPLSPVWPRTLGPYLFGVDLHHLGDHGGLGGLAVEGQSLDPDGPKSSVGPDGSAGELSQEPVQVFPIEAGISVQAACIIKK